MDDKLFEIKGIDVDYDAIKLNLDKAIEEKERNGSFEVLNVESMNDIDFLDLNDDQKFLEYYLNVIKKTWAIDINDFEIPKKPGILGKIELILKKIIWKLLKFYTYRLFSQQIEFNSQIKNTILAVHQDFSKKISQLEQQIKSKNI